MQDRSGPVVFLGGGPGLPVAYAAGPLRRTAFARGWSFFEQPGCDGGEPATAQDVVDEATAFVVARIAAHPVTLIAHSWGALLALALLDRLPAYAIAHTVLVHPAPPTRAGFDEAVADLFARLSPDALRRAEPFMARTDAQAGRAVMEILLPAYCGREADLPRLDLALNPAAYHGVMASLGDYDQRAAVAAHGERLTLVFGEADTVTPALYARHCDGFPALDRATLPGGHFGFLEDLPGFEAILRRRGVI